VTDDLAKLIERLEAATGPDRELDEMIRVALGYPPKPWNYTSSIDSAMTLVDGNLWTMDSWSGPAWSAGIWSPFTHRWLVYCDKDRRRPTPALALCIAALKARLQSGGGNG